MRKAVIDATGKVVNIVVVPDDWTGTVGEWSPPEDHQAIDAGESGPGYTWDGSSFTEPVTESVDPWISLRKERDRLLSECDWWALSDTPEMTSEQTNYRQALRDLPASTSNPSSPIWPII